MDIIKLENYLKEKGEKNYRLKQIKRAVFSELINDWDEASALSKELRKELSEKFSIASLELLSLLESKNKDSVKAAFKLKDGNIIETVLMRHLPALSRPARTSFAKPQGDHAGRESFGRNTVCVSSQAGCAMNCGFCATGKMGLKRNLTSEEIVDQILFFARWLCYQGHHQGESLTSRTPLDGDVRVNNVVFMGMGEPFLNYENTIEAIRILNDKDGFNLGIRHISISTCGIAPGIEKFASENFQANLAISLHAADDKTRSKLMPINDTYPLTVLMSVVDDYVKKTNRKVMFEYLLIEGVNDRPEDANNLAKLMKNSLYHVNLIKYHDHARNADKSACEAGRPKYKTSSEAKRNAFFDKLKKLGISVTFRVSFGEDILAACGQLAGGIR